MYIMCRRQCDRELISIKHTEWIRKVNLCTWIKNEIKYTRKKYIYIFVYNFTYITKPQPNLLHLQFKTIWNKSRFETNSNHQSIIHLKMLLADQEPWFNMQQKFISKSFNLLSGSCTSLYLTSWLGRSGFVWACSIRVSSTICIIPSAALKRKHKNWLPYTSV